MIVANISHPACCLKNWLFVKVFIISVLSYEGNDLYEKNGANNAKL